MQNIHPVYHIKELMIKDQLSKDPELKDESWDRYLPQFKKRNVKKKSKKPKKVEKEYNPFPPEQMPRKVDMELETGEYWEKKDKKSNTKSNKKNEEDEQTNNIYVNERKQKKNESYIAPQEPEYIKKSKSNKEKQEGPSLDELKSKFLNKK